ncbi:hypothetical protein, partial [Rhizobium lusitanum]|uniref:hypothetical protein n=1 Tax=Rhizobium lusitanum TaxID=293958 RepID=UPI0019593881
NESALLAAAEAMRDAEIGYRINLTRLVDDVAEHTATLPDGSTHIFPTSATASEFVERERNFAMAKAAVEAYLAAIYPLEKRPAAFEVLDTENGVYLTRSEQAAINNGFEYNGLYRRAAVLTPPSIPSDEGSEKP